jgi:hypothetical protein
VERENFSYDHLENELTEILNFFATVVLSAVQEIIQIHEDLFLDMKSYEVIEEVIPVVETPPPLPIAPQSVSIPSPPLMTSPVQSIAQKSHHSNHLVMPISSPPLPQHHQHHHPPPSLLVPSSSAASNSVLMTPTTTEPVLSFGSTDTTSDSRNPYGRSNSFLSDTRYRFADLLKTIAYELNYQGKIKPIDVIRMAEHDLDMKYENNTPSLIRRAVLILEEMDPELLLDLERC